MNELADIKTRLDAAKSGMRKVRSDGVMVGSERVANLNTTTVKQDDEYRITSASFDMVDAEREFYENAHNDVVFLLGKITDYFGDPAEKVVAVSEPETADDATDTVGTISEEPAPEKELSKSERRRLRQR